MNARDGDRLSRWTATAGTWAAKATASLLRHAETERQLPSRWFVGYQAELLLRGLLEEAETLSRLVNPDAVEDGLLERTAGEVRDALRRRRLAAAMENTDGRTAEEARAFRAKADQLVRP